MSVTLQLSGNDSVLKAQFFPPINLRSDFELALLNLETWNSIANVTEKNNHFYYDNKVIKIPIGSYEITDIANYLERILREHYLQSPLPETPHSELNDKAIFLLGNRQTLKSEIISRHAINFKKPNNIGSVLGFKEIIIKPLKKYESNDLVNIIQVETLRIECNIITGSYSNGKPTHTLYEFFPDVSPGYKIVEVPRNLIYLPVTVRVIDNIEIKICDQNNNLVNLRGEKTNIRLHLRPQNANYI